MNLDLRIAPSNQGASLSRYRWSKIPGAGHLRKKLTVAITLKVIDNRSIGYVTLDILSAEFFVWALRELDEPVNPTPGND